MAAIRKKAVVEDCECEISGLKKAAQQAAREVNQFLFDFFQFIILILLLFGDKKFTIK